MLYFFGLILYWCLGTMCYKEESLSEDYVAFYKIAGDTL